MLSDAVRLSASAVTLLATYSSVERFTLRAVGGLQIGKDQALGKGGHLLTSSFAHHIARRVNFIRLKEHLHV